MRLKCCFSFLVLDRWKKGIPLCSRSRIQHCQRRDQLSDGTLKPPSRDRQMTFLLHPRGEGHHRRLIMLSRGLPSVVPVDIGGSEKPRNATKVSANRSSIVRWMIVGAKSMGLDSMQPEEQELFVFCDRLLKGCSLLKRCAARQHEKERSQSQSEQAESREQLLGSQMTLTRVGP